MCNAIIDFINCEREICERSKNFCTWERKSEILSDHKVVSVKIRGKLSAAESERKVQIERKQNSENKRGWNRKERGREEAWKNLENC